MGDFLSGVLGTNSSVGVNTNDQFTNLSPWIDRNKTLADQLQQQSRGNGPNPAQLQLQKNAQMLAQQQAMQNAQNRAINPGLAARLSGNEAAMTGSNAVANSGIQQAQQQLASQQLLGNVNAQQQQALNSAGAVNAGVAGGNQKASQGIVGGIFSGAGSLVGMAHSKGGEISGPKSFIGKHLSSKNMKSGGPVGGRASIPGDSLKNDTVPAVLSPGEIVIPRSISQSDDAPKKAAAFVAAVLAKKNSKVKR